MLTLIFDPKENIFHPITLLFLISVLLPGPSYLEKIMWKLNDQELVTVLPKEIEKVWSFHRNRKWKVVTLGQTNDLSVICHVLRVLVPFLQFKKREKHPWRKVTYLVSVWMAAKFFLCCLFPCNSETVKAATLAFCSIQ